MKTVATQYVVPYTQVTGKDTVKKNREDGELLQMFEINFTALSKSNQEKVMALFVKRNKLEQEDFEEAHETWFQCVLAHKDAPFEVVETVVHGIDNGLVLPA